MITLDEMKDIIIDTLYNYSAYQLPAICESVGLSSGTVNEAMKSKKNYISNRIVAFNKNEIIDVLHKIKDKLDITLIPEEKYSYVISDVTKRDITDILVNGLEIQDFMETKTVQMPWNGRMSEIDFIKRVCDVSKIPVDDKRCNNFEEEYFRHRVNNDDYDNDYFFELEKLPYKSSNTNNFLKILCEMFHPEVRNENGYWHEFLDAFNKLIREDGYELYPASQISGRDVYDFRKITFLNDGTIPPVLNLKELCNEINSEYIYKQIKVMEQSQKDNPTEAIGKAKELLETICKAILERMGKEYTDDWDVSKLTKETYKVLKLSPDDVKENSLTQTVKQILGGLNSISGGLASLRNSYGSGHGKDEKFKPLPERYAKLAVGSVSTLVVFLWETMLYQIEKNK